MCFDYRAFIHHLFAYSKCAECSVHKNIQHWFLGNLPRRLRWYTSGAGVWRHYAFYVIEDQFTGGQLDFFYGPCGSQEPRGRDSLFWWCRFPVSTAADLDQCSKLLRGDKVHFNYSSLKTSICGILCKLLQVLHKFRGQMHENMLINMTQPHGFWF